MDSFTLSYGNKDLDIYLFLVRSNSKQIGSPNQVPLLEDLRSGR
ncbi:hypothetical protein [Metallosphaera hakonensis]|nr:hypothetical protein [Metallosphaera hakonensis]